MGNLNIVNSTLEETPRKRRVHLIGIGGVGMSALARLLSASGTEVSGSDIRETDALATLRDANIDVSLGHDPRLVDAAEEIVISPAVPKHNSELMAARKKGIRIVSRAEALSEFLKDRTRICVTGSHGKTTTAAMLAFVLERNGMDPGYMIGGISKGLSGSNARVGRGPFVIEACEAFGALHSWVPAHCIVTNVDDEHTDHYGGMEGLQRAFRQLIDRVSDGGTTAIHENAVSALGVCGYGGRLDKRIVSYGFGSASVVRAKMEELHATGSCFTVFEHDNEIGRVELQVPGSHNVCNSLAATIVAKALGIPFRDIAIALHDFRGVDRRCQLLGEADGICVFDDYAHHPVEIEAVIAATRRFVRPGSRLVVALEPQLNSRVRRLASSFAAALSVANVIFLMPVDAAGETSVEMSDDVLAHALESSGATFFRIASPEQVATMAVQQLKPGDTFVAMGPGRIATVGKLVLKRLRSRRNAFTSSRPEELSISIGHRMPAIGSAVLLEQFFENVRAAPDAVAVTCGVEQLSYRELGSRATDLAIRLAKEGIGRESVVAVRLRRSVNRTVAFLGTLMAGAVYLPIDPSIPNERANFMISDAEAGALVSDSSIQASRSEVRVLLPPYSAPPVEQQPERLSFPRSCDAAYIIYTSGTTGVPKGVIVEHAALHNCAKAAVAQFGIDRDSRVSQISSFGFDVAIGEMAMALYAGARLVIPDDHSAQPGAPLGAFIRDTLITHLSLTPSALSVLPHSDYHNLTHIIVSGEKCPEDLAARWASCYRFFNAYGPTEATVWCTVDEVLPGSAVTIGRALQNVEIYILNNDRKPVPRATTGEIWIAGIGLARGYIGGSKLTDERFSCLFFGGRCIRAYKTGDLATMSTDGRIHFLGRADNQIKLRGFRIELGEIEAALRRHPDIRDAVVDARKDATGSDRLIAYLVPTNATAPRHEDIVAFLSDWLPGYMIPSIVIQIESLPLNQNQKLDRTALPSPPVNNSQRGRPRKAARTVIEGVLMDIFRRELSLQDDCGIRDTLAELAIDSLQTANLFLAIEAHFGIQLPHEAFSSSATVELLALYIERADSTKCTYVADPSLLKSIIRKQLGHLSAWTGSRVSVDSLICSHNVTGSRPPLFWCCQGNHEHESLAVHLGADQPLHGMRSGHLVFRYKEETVKTLAVRYADEMVAMQPEGPFRIGGNCQGGIIAQQVAEELRSRGRVVTLLCLLGQDRFSPYDGQVALIFTADSPRNPYRTMSAPHLVFGTAYRAGYTVYMIPGDDANSFVTPNIEELAKTIHKCVSAHS